VNNVTKMSSLDYSADVFGVGSVVDAVAKQANENAAGRCTYFDDSFERISAEFATHSIKRAEKLRELNKVEQKIEKLNAKQKELRRELDQLDADRQIMLENAKRPNAPSDHEKLLMARACYKQAYEPEEFATLYFGQFTKEIREMLGKGEERDANPVFYECIQALIRGIRRYKMRDASGIERLAGYVKHPDGFPIQAYQAVCRRLNKKIDKPIFTLREQWPLEAIELAYDNLPSTKALREAEQAVRGKRELKREDQDEIVEEVLRMSFDTVTEQTLEVMERFKKKGLAASWKTAERALRRYKEKYEASKPNSIMLS
jgi:hypothetical protein